MKSIEINLGKTRTIHDSGHDSEPAMLLMLRALTTLSLDPPVRLVNCGADIRDRLTASRLHAQFQFG